MHYFFNIADKFLSAISDIGDFLLYEPFTPEFLDDYGFLFLSKGQQIELARGLNALEDVCVAEFLIGAGIVFILSFKLCKFFVGIVTGS